MNDSFLFGISVDSSTFHRYDDTQLLWSEVMKNHEKLAPGMFYGLNFPWTEEMLLSPKFGAEWLTQAMHVAGTLSQAGDGGEVRRVMDDIQWTNMLNVAMLEFCRSFFK